MKDVRPEESPLESMLRAASQARTGVDASPTAEALLARDRIMRDARPRRRRRAVAIGWASGLALAAASVVVAAAVVVPQMTARAGASFSSSAAPTSVAQIVEAARNELSDSVGPAEPKRFAQTASWNFSINGDTGELKAFTQLSTITWEPDGSGHVVLVNSPEQDPNDAEWYSHSEISGAGNIEEFDMLPGEFVTPLTEPPGNSRAGVQDALDALQTPSDPSAFEVVTAITTLFGQWTLTNEQHAALLSILDEAGDAEVVPATTDRLGRPIHGIRVLSDDGAVSDVLFISIDTGRIVGLERTIVKADSLLPAGAILSYQLWDVEGLVE